MTADPRVYDSERVADAYAHTRPPIHPRVWERIAPQLPLALPVQSALDIGCGGGASTAALQPYARRLTGIDLFQSMVRHCAAVLPASAFVHGSAEALPFDDRAFQLVTAAGSLNYTDPARSVAEASRVLAPGGCFVPYDFATGHRMRGDSLLHQLFAGFRADFPAPPGYALDLAALPYAQHALQRLSYQEFDVAVAMSGAEYAAYLMGDAGVEVAIAGGRPADDAQAWIARAFEPVFRVGPRAVLFNVQVAVAHKPARAPR